MKITIVGPIYPYRGGIAQYNAYLAKALPRYGHQAQIISFKQQYPNFLYPGESDKDPSQEGEQITAEYLLSPFFPWSWHSAAKAIEEFAPDFVIIHWWVTFWGPADFVLAKLLKTKKLPVVYLIHNTLPHEVKPWDRWLARLALQEGTTFIAQNPNDEAKLKKLLPDAKPKFCKLPLYHPFKSEFIAKDDARRLADLPINAHILLFFGIVRPYKGLTYLLQAFAQVTPKNRLLHLVIAGEFWEDIKKYEYLIDKLGLSPKVTLINQYIPNEEAHILFCGADVLVAPYTGGTQSAVASLALGYKLPMIVTERVAAGMTNPDAESVKVVPSQDVDSLASAIQGFAEKLPTTTQQNIDEWRYLIQVLEEIKTDIV